MRMHGEDSIIEYFKWSRKYFFTMLHVFLLQNAKKQAGAHFIGHCQLSDKRFSKSKAPIYIF